MLNHPVSTKVSCHKCGQQFHEDVMVQIRNSVYCESCANMIAESRNRRTILIISVVGVMGVLAIVIGAFAWMYQKNKWDFDHRTEILMLKAQAETAQSHGFVKDAGLAYEALFRIVDGHIAQTTELSTAISQARSAFDLIESDYHKVLAQEAEAKRIADEKARKDKEEQERLALVERERQEKMVREAREAEERERQKGTIHGNLQVTLSSGQTWSLAGTEILLLPEYIPVKKEDYKWQLAVVLPKITVDRLKKSQREEDQRSYQVWQSSVLNGIEAAERAGRAETTTVAFWSYMKITGDPRLLINVASGRQSYNPAEVIEDEEFWKILREKAVAVATTDRDGQFGSFRVAPGRYVVLCRIYRSASGEFAAWRVPFDIEPRQDKAVTLDGKNAVIVKVANY